MIITGAQIKAARKLLYWAQDDVAGACGVETATIVSFEMGKRSPDRQTLANTLESAGIEFAPGEPGAKLKGVR